MLVYVSIIEWVWNIGEVSRWCSNDLLEKERRQRGEPFTSTQISNVIIGVVSNLTSATKSNNISLYTECQTLPHFVISHDIIDCLVSLSSGVRAVTALQLLTPSLTSPSHLSDSEQWAVNIKPWGKFSFIFPVFWIDFLIIALAQLVLGINFAKTLNHCIQSWLLYQYSRNHLGNLSDIRCYQGSGIIRQAGHRFPPVKTETWILASIGHHK